MFVVITLFFLVNSLPQMGFPPPLRELPGPGLAFSARSGVAAFTTTHCTFHAFYAFHAFWDPLITSFVTVHVIELGGRYVPAVRCLVRMRNSFARRLGYYYYCAGASY